MLRAMNCVPSENKPILSYEICERKGRFILFFKKKLIEYFYMLNLGEK